MDAPTTWLKAQQEMISGDLEKAQQEFEQAQNRLQALQKRFDACTEMLEVAEAEQMDKDVDELVASTIRVGKRPTMTMPDQMEELLNERGPLNSKEICEFLKQQGRPNTTPNSINTQLSKYRPTRFDKNEDGKWYAVSKEATGSLLEGRQG